MNVPVAEDPPIVYAFTSKYLFFPLFIIPLCPFLIGFSNNIQECNFNFP